MEEAAARAVDAAPEAEAEVEVEVGKAVEWDAAAAGNSGPIYLPLTISSTRPGKATL